MGGENKVEMGGKKTRGEVDLGGSQGSVLHCIEEQFTVLYCSVVCSVVYSNIVYCSLF